MLSIRDISTIFLGLCAGVIGGYVFSLVFVPEVFARSATPFAAEKPPSIEVRGTVQSYDAETHTLYMRALSPYAPEETRILRVQVSEQTAIVYSPDVYEDHTGGTMLLYAEKTGTTALLTPERRVYAFINRAQPEFTAFSIRVFGPEEL